MRRILLTILLILILVSCKKEKSLNFHYDYYPIVENQFVTYKVDQVITDITVNQHDTLSYFMKVQIGVVEIDNEGRTVNRVNRYVGPSATGPWTLQDIWTTLIDGDKAELIEENNRIIKLIFSPTKTKEWDANAFTNLVPLDCYYDEIHKEKVINGFPLKFSADASGTRATNTAETQSGGNAVFGVSKVSGNQGVQLYKINADLERLIKVDSIFNSTRQLLMNLDVPSVSIVVDVQPIKVFIKSDELNLGEPLQIKIIEPALKKRLGDLGCSFVKNEANADYKISISTSTKDLGVMWGSMLQSGIELQIIVEDLAKDSELFKDNLQGIKGYQITKERAGIEAYNNLMIDFNKKIYPHLRAAILQE
jgi:hypothetical protein